MRHCGGGLPSAIAISAENRSETGAALGCCAAAPVLLAVATFFELVDKNSYASAVLHTNTAEINTVSKLSKLSGADTDDLRAKVGRGLLSPIWLPSISRASRICSLRTSRQSGPDRTGPDL